MILIEKVRGESDGLNELFVEQYHSYKRSQGYSKLEIAKKREALENVLVPLKPGKNRDLLIEAGFRQIDVFFQMVQFRGISGRQAGEKKGLNQPNACREHLKTGYK